MRNKTVLKLEARLHRQETSLRRTQGQLRNARHADSRRQKRDLDSQCYNLGMAMEGAVRSSGFSERSQEFLNFLGTHLAAAMRGISTPGPLPLRALHSRRFRWGTAVKKMIEAERMSIAESTGIARKYLQGRRLRIALLGIDEAATRIAQHAAGSSRPLPLPANPNSESAAKMTAAAPIGAPVTPPCEVHSTSPKNTLYVLGKFLGFAASHKVGDRQPYLHGCRQLTDKYHGEGEAVGRIGLEYLAAGHALEIKWRGAAHLAWGRAVLHHMRLQPDLSRSLVQVAVAVLTEPFLAEALHAIQDIRQAVIAGRTSARPE